MVQGMEVRLGLFSITNFCKARISPIDAGMEEIPTLFKKSHRTLRSPLPNVGGKEERAGSWLSAHQSIEVKRLIVSGKDSRGQETIVKVFSDSRLPIEEGKAFIAV